MLRRLVTRLRPRHLALAAVLTILLLLNVWTGGNSSTTAPNRCDLSGSTARALLQEGEELGGGGSPKVDGDRGFYIPVNIEPACRGLLAY